MFFAKFEIRSTKIYFDDYSCLSDARLFQEFVTQNSLLITRQK